MGSDDVREKAEALLAEVDRMFRDGERGILFECEFRALRAALAVAPATGDAAAVREIRDYAVESAATCRRAESERAADIANRAENHAILPMLREQHYSWGEKAKSYDALVAFIDALPLPAPATAVEEAQAWKYLHLLRHAHGLLMGGKAPADPDRHSAFLNEIDALLAAEAAATHAAQGGV